MVVIGNFIGQIGELRLEARLLAVDEALPDIAEFAGLGQRAVLENALAALECEVQAREGGIALLELIDHAQRLQVVLEAAVLAHALVERILAGVPEGRVAEIMGQRYGLDQRFIELQRAGDGAGDLRHFNRVRDARAIQIAFVVDEHLGLVRQAPKGIRVDDAIAVALEFAAILRRRLGVSAAARASIVRRVGGQHVGGLRGHAPKCSRSVSCSASSA